MSANPIRVATAALSERIFAGRPTKDGRGFKEPRYDVTSDVLQAIRDKVGIGNEIEVGLAGTGVEFRIAVLPPYTAPSPSPSAWQPIETAPRDEPILAAIEVQHNVSGDTWWERHIIWCDDETNAIHPDCEQGWEFDDYTHWMPLPSAPEPTS